MLACTSLSALIKAASVGATLAFSAGPCDRVTVQDVHVSGVTVDLSGSTFTTLALYNVSGITFTGLHSVGAPYFGADVRGSDHLTFVNPVCEGPGAACLSFTDSHDLAVSGGWVRGSASDGIDYSAVENLTVRGFVSSGTVPTAGAHPDCIQGFSNPLTKQGNHHILISGNACFGDTMGFTVWDHLNVSDDITLENNTAAISYANCWSLLGASASRATDNRCYTLAHGAQVRGYPVEPADMQAQGNVDGDRP